MNNFFLNSENNTESQAVENNHIQRYIQNLAPETITQLSQPASPEVLETIESTIAGMLGNLPEEDFDVTITTNRQNLVRLVASAMINGYFLRNVEQRMLFEKSLFEN
jgi:DNA-binding GntR family transcriptional regulator